jgi:hypothetical protein
MPHEYPPDPADPANQQGEFGSIVQPGKGVSRLERPVSGAPTSIPLNEHTRWILGQPGFACRHVAQLLRDTGVKVDSKAEDEQAAVIHFYLSFYLEHGETWREMAKQEILNRVEIVKNKYANEDGT